MSKNYFKKGKKGKKGTGFERENEKNPRDPFKKPVEIGWHGETIPKFFGSFLSHYSPVTNTCNLVKGGAPNPKSKPS